MAIPNNMHVTSVKHLGYIYDICGFFDSVSRSGNFQ